MPGQQLRILAGLARDLRRSLGPQARRNQCRAIQTVTCADDGNVPLHVHDATPPTPAVGSTAEPSHRVAGSGAEADQQDWHRQSSDSSKGIVISKARFEEFLSAEIYALGQGDYSEISLEKILQHSQPRQLGKFIVRELPRRFATRIRQIESTHPHWKDMPLLADVHSMFSRSFRSLRMVEAATGIGKEPDLEMLKEAIEDVARRHGPALPMLVQCTLDVKERGLMEPHDLEKWIWRIANSRIGNDILMKHYLRLLEGGETDGQLGIVSTQCDPLHLVEQAMERVNACLVGMPVTIKLQVPKSHNRSTFPFIEEYFSCIVEELLKNAAAASLMSLEQGKRKGQQKIILQFCASEHIAAVAVSDEAGGICYGHTDRIWECMFSTTPPHIAELFEKLATPLTVPRMGLPLCRLYTEYLGGKIDLLNMPQLGVDAYARFERLDVAAARKTPNPA